MYLKICTEEVRTRLGNVIGECYICAKIERRLNYAW